MKKILIYLSVTVMSILIAISIYFAITLRPINISVYSTKGKEELVLDNIKVYSYKYHELTFAKDETIVYYRDLSNVLDSIN